MIIDVVDLRFEILEFNRSYETSRYKRGTSLYNKGLVNVEKVDQIDESNYSVQASVEGNYDMYTTTLEISGNKITESTCTCEDYNKGNLCKHIIATSMEIIAPHYASTVEGIKTLEKRRKEEAKKKAEELKLKQEQERKKREYERKYYTGLQTIELYKRNLKQGSRNTLNLEEIYEKTTEIKNRKTENLSTSIKLEYSGEIEGRETLRLSFKIGPKRMYVLHNISDFYEAYIKGEELYYGKQLSFIPKRENFTEDSQHIFDYIIKYAEMVDYNKRNSAYPMDSSLNKFIYLTGDSIDEFFSVNKNKTILINSYYNDSAKYEFTD